MLRGRHSHAFIELCQGFLLVTGGKSPSCVGFSKSCEFYNIEYNEWTEISELNQERGLHTSFVFSKKAVYVYGGQNIKGTLSSFEKLSIEEPSGITDSKWEVLEIEEIIPRQPTINIASLLINEDEVLIFGKYSQFNEETGTCFSYNKSTNKLEKHENLPQPADFYRGMTCFFEERWYFLSIEGMLFMFNGKIWSRLDKVCL